MPSWWNASSGLISGMTSGTSSTYRNALELSITTAPALAAAGANALLCAAPALKYACSMPAKEFSVSSSTRTSSPRKRSVLPTLRWLASSRSERIGELRFSKRPKKSAPPPPGPRAEAERLADAALARKQPQRADRVVALLEEAQEIGAHRTGRARNGDVVARHR